jgi:hypothetical protein
MTRVCEEATMNPLRAAALVLILCLLPATAPGQSAAPPAAGDRPKVVFAELEHNFGDLKPNQETTCDFKFRNAGTGVLEILNVRSTCGCTAVAPDKKALAPGESSVIKVRYHAGRTPGVSEKKIMVYTNDPDQGEVVLTIRAAIQTDLEFTPSYVRFDNIPADQPAEAFIFFAAKNPDGFKLTDLKADDPFIRCEMERLEDGRFRLTATFVPAQVTVEHRGYLNSTIRAQSNTESYPEIQIPVYIKFQEEFSAVPVRLMMYGLKEGEGAVRDVIVKNNKGASFQITAAESSNPFVRAEVARNGEAANLVKITIDAKAPAGLCNAMVTVRMGSRQLTIPVRARIGDAAAAPVPPAARPSGPAAGR